MDVIVRFIALKILQLLGFLLFMVGIAGFMGCVSSFWIFHLCLSHCGWDLVYRCAGLHVSVRLIP